MYNTKLSNPMCTTQKYAEGGNHAQNPSQTVEAPRFAPLSPDEREKMNKQLYALQGQLLEMVDSIACIHGEGTDPITLIADLLQNLLSRPTDELASDYSRDKFRIGLQLIAFLSEVRQVLYQHEVIADRLEGGKEVSGEH